MKHHEYLRSALTDELVSALQFLTHLLSHEVASSSDLKLLLAMRSIMPAPSAQPELRHVDLVKATVAGVDDIEQRILLIEALYAQLVERTPQASPSASGIALDRVQMALEEYNLARSIEIIDQLTKQVGFETMASSLIVGLEEHLEGAMQAPFGAWISAHLLEQLLSTQAVKHPDNARHMKMQRLLERTQPDQLKGKAIRELVTEKHVPVRSNTTHIPVMHVRKVLLGLPIRK